MTTPEVRIIVCDRCDRRWTSLDWISPENQKCDHACGGAL